ncbi:MAG: hypothetical protein WA913_13600, partial [Pricia sp.]
AKQQAKEEKAVRDSIVEQEKEAAEVLKKQEKETEKKAAQLAEEEADRKEAEVQEAERRESEQEERQKQAMEQEAAEKRAAEQKAANEAERQKAAQEQAEAVVLKAEQQRKIDSVAEARAAAIRAAKKAQEAESEEQPTPVAERPQAGEKYEEVRTEAGLLPGYYLIANVFGTQKYYDAFMDDLQSKGMQPKSFRRSTNGYNYVYLQRYKTIQEARAARDSQYGGKYTGATWIFRVTGE